MMTHPTADADCYGCLRFHKRGLHACRNGLQIRQDALDAAVVEVLVQDALDAAVVEVLVKALEPDVPAEAVRSAVAELQADHAALTARRSTVTGELATIANRERRLLDALVDGDADAAATAIRARLREELARRDTLTAELAKLDETPTLDADAIVADVQARANDLRGLLARHVAQARQVVKLLLESRLVCQPFDEDGEIGYTFTATGSYRRLGVPVVESVNVGGGPNGIQPTDVFPPVRWLTRLPFEGLALSPQPTGIPRRCDCPESWHFQKWRGSS
jgi:hypothetical protein